MLPSYLSQGPGHVPGSVLPKTSQILTRRDGVGSPQDSTGRCAALLFLKFLKLPEGALGAKPPRIIALWAIILEVLIDSRLY